MGLDPRHQHHDEDDEEMEMMMMSNSNDVSEDWRAQVHIHDSLDAQNTFGNWCSAHVVETTPMSIVVRYNNMNPCWDERLPRDSLRLSSPSSMAQNDSMPVKLGQLVHIFENQWKEAQVTCIHPEEVRVSFPGNPTQKWIPFDPRFIAPSEKHHMRRIRLSNPSYDQYSRALQHLDYTIVPVEGDGNCLFRSVSHQLYGDDRHHTLVRKFCMDYMELEKEYFEPFVVGDMAAFLRYVNHKRHDAVWGDDPELQAICELYDRSAEVFAYDAQVGAKRLRTFHENSERPSICLSFYGGGHYDSLVGRQHRLNLITETPGVYEARRLAVASSKRWSAEEAKALEISRREFGGMAMNLDAALNASIESYEAEVARQIESTDVRAVQEESELDHLQTEMLKSVAQQSEDELVQQAVQASLDPYEDALQQALALTAQENMIAAIEESAFFDEDEAMQQAIQMSLMQ
ncbi:hypothetical protein LEN26_014838 [Aphanomyces euteiches]|nr:hypothetical protein LEN26_014838 [Aphanomyces euteiches]KAH9122526.1 hypothetical protein AeMF1_006198 [Aphanomyces euteiches]KAH9188597.1 hypothetical protein AeNC1_009424 [Aphanomyces euteiches]